MVKADDLLSPHPLAPIKNSLKLIIQHEWLNHININAVILCSLFNFDPAYISFRGEDRIQADDWFTEWGTKFIKHYSLSVHDDEKDITQALEEQRSQFLAREGLFHSLEQRRVNLGNGKGHARRLWGGYLSTIPEMAACVLALLELTASEASVERSFSRQGILHSKARNRLADDSVHVQMAFAFNTRALAISDGIPTPKRPAAAKNRDMREGAELLDSDGISRGTVLLTEYLPDDEVIAEKSDSESDEEQDEEEMDDPGEAVEEDEGGKEEEEEKEAAISMEERVQKVVTTFCEQARVTQGFRWNGPREQLLHALIVDAGIDALLEPMKARVKAHVASPPAQTAVISIGGVADPYLAL
jgi:hypothetical protein